MRECPGKDAYHASPFGGNKEGWIVGPDPLWVMGLFCNGGAMSPISYVLKLLWRDRRLILLGGVVGVVVGVLLVFRPAAAHYDAIYRLVINSRFAQIENTYEEFLVQWKRTPLWDENQPVTPSTWFEYNNMTGAIRLIANDPSGKSIAEYAEKLNEQVELFKARVAQRAQTSLRELEAVSQMPGADAGDYVVSAAHADRMEIAESPDLLKLETVEPFGPAQGLSTRVLTFVIAVFAGLVLGALFSISWAIWQSGAATGRKPTAP